MVAFKPSILLLERRLWNKSKTRVTTNTWSIRDVNLRERICPPSNSKLQHSPTGKLPGILTFEVWFVQIPAPPGTKLCSNALPKCQIWRLIFLLKGKISDCNFLHIDQAVTPKRCRPFLLTHSLAKVNSLPVNTSKSKDIALVFR